ncbi:MAG TPA: methionine--tRNA ligase [Candidatus Woesebacteria bacterium]|nr:methionine--tRNA ligase [Candidatus Woesebacteria bacterium]
MKNSFYITTTLPYVNASPHIGFGLEIVEADVIARYQRLQKKQVIFNTGTDEHGQKIYQQALASNLEPQQYCDQFSALFSQLKDQLNLSYDYFIRTTDPRHQEAAQHFWNLAQTNGDIYKARYQTKYCVGCEMEKTESELTDGRCPIHPHLELEMRDEENYFFRFSRYQKPLLSFYDQHPDFVEPESKMKEAVAFVKQGLHDFSISRVKSKMPWGISVPNDPDQVMYVWFDALVNYISTLGWPSDQSSFEQYWPGVQVAGKDNLRQQAIMWQAMLMSVKLPLSAKILINGFISINGEKMSKSKENVISPQQMVDRYQSDATRYLLISLGSFGQDMDVNWEKFDSKYTSDLANGIGNLSSRIAKMSSQINLVFSTLEIAELNEYQQMMEKFQLTQALAFILSEIKKCDLFLSQTQPWLQPIKKKESLLTEAIIRLRQIAQALAPFMPNLSAQLLTHFSNQIKPISPLFPRLESQK